jgi:hypothetical protein
MKSFSFAKALTVGCLLSLSLPIACGDDDDSTPNNTAGTSSTGGDGAGGEPGAGGMSEAAGAGGAGASLPPGISSMPKTEACGTEMCGSAAVGPVFIDPCCDSGACGLDTGFLALVGASFTDKCQPKAQPGEVDANCATTEPSTIPFPSGGNTIMVPINGFVGCCRDNGMCGVVVDDVVSPVLGKVATLGLGCVDAAPFFPGVTPVSCGAGGGGGGGAGGVGVGGAGGAGGGDTSTLGGTGGAGGIQ